MDRKDMARALRELTKASELLKSAGECAIHANILMDRFKNEDGTRNYQYQREMPAVSAVLYKQHQWLEKFLEETVQELEGVIDAQTGSKGE